jgi:diol dehydratase reactivase alpha subunit
MGRGPCAPLHDALGSAGERVRDVFAVDLSSIRQRFFPRQGSVDLNEVPIAALVAPASSPSPPEAALAAATDRPVHVLPSEAEAAALGALTTPGAPEDAAVCDMGGGTVDLVWGDQRLTAAGAGELLTVSVARALGVRNSMAEYVKRSASFRAEAPHAVHYEDGSRGFAETSLPADSLGRLCFMRGKTPVPFSDRLAPEEWRSLRLAIKQQVIGANVGRCLKWLTGAGGRGTPNTLLLCGGAALDAESVRIVSESLRVLETTVGRANVAGSYGPRYGVAMGLLLAFHASNKSGG